MASRGADQCGRPGTFRAECVTHAREHRAVLPLTLEQRAPRDEMLQLAYVEPTIRGSKRYCGDQALRVQR